MAMMRESSFMPTIKCSQCGRQVEISMMGDHICGGPGGEPSPPPDMSNSFGSYNEPPPDKYARMAPPRVDTSAANRTYMRQGQLTPVSSSSGSRSISPKTPDGRPGAGRGEDYFAPKIADDYESTPPQARRPGGYGGFADQDGFNSQMYPQNSPKKQAPSLLQRMNTIAPGPFEAGRRPIGSGRNAFAKNSSEENTMDSYSRAGYSIDRPGTATSNRSGTSSSSNPGLTSAPRMPRTNGYGGFGPPGSNDDFQPEPPFGGMNRAGTFPRPSDPVEAPMRAPSAPGPRPDRFRRPSNASSNGSGRRPSFGAGPDTTRPPPPRTSLVRPTTSGKGSGNINLAAEFGIGNPYHTPSDSISSSISAYSSTPSQPSSQSSPDRARPTKDRADTSGFDSLMNDLMYGIDAKNLPPTPKQPPPFEKPSGSLRSRDRRPADIAVQPAPQGRSERQRSPLMTPRYDMPIDTDRRNPYGGFEARDNRYGASPQKRSMSPQGRRRNGSVPPPSSRGFCRACGEGITGKSISSADGRLTGRYHKACFNCTTCREPFASSTFYVHGDQPYCELHYHKLNGSLCATCGRGIEGQYLEDEERVKYHVGCFRCADCGMSLSNGYFEVDGKSYCEKDAWRRSQDTSVSTGPAGNGPAGTEVDLRMGGMSGRATPGPMPAGLPAPGRPGSRKGSFSSLGTGVGTSGTPGGPMVPGLPRGQKLAPGMGPTPRPRMNKRMTRLGMM